MRKNATRRCRCRQDLASSSGQKRGTDRGIGKLGPGERRAACWLVLCPLLVRPDSRVGRREDPGAGLLGGESRFFPSGLCGPRQVAEASVSVSSECDVNVPTYLIELSEVKQAHKISPSGSTSQWVHSVQVCVSVENKRSESRFQQSERQGWGGGGAEWLAHRPWHQTLAP